MFTNTVLKHIVSKYSGFKYIFHVWKFNNWKFSLNYIQKVINFVDEHPNVKFKSIQNNFRRVIKTNYITPFRTHLQNLGSRTEKLELIKRFVLEKFIRSWKVFLPVHDIDLRKWAIQQSIDLKTENFVASDYWMHYFKFDYGIVSRKVTKLVTKL